MLGLVSAPMVTASAEETGWDAYVAHRFDDAVRLWRTEAVEGSASAKLGLGVAYELGQGVTADQIQACFWYRQAGETGSVVGGFNAGVMIDTGRCGPRQPAEAATWYARAAAGGHGLAQYDLARLYAAGDGVPQNLDQAAVWSRLAAANGVDAAATWLSRHRDIRPPRPSNAPLVPVVPVTPDRPTLLGTEGDIAQTAFVWKAPKQPAPTRFFVEVFAVSDAEPREIYARYAEQSAVMVALTTAPAEYAWRVFTVGSDRPRYVASVWTRFTIIGAAKQ